MADYVWPVEGSFPQTPLYSGFTETPPNLAMRTPMGAGPDKVRRRYTDGPRLYSMTLGLTEKQAEILDTFYFEDLLTGQYEFEWVDPRDTGTAKDMLFVAKPVYIQHAPNLWHANIRVVVEP